MYSNRKICFKFIQKLKFNNLVQFKFTFSIQFYVIELYYMPNLSLVRHTKSDWNNFTGDDMSGPISSRGERGTQKILNFLENKEKELFFWSFFLYINKNQGNTKNFSK